MTTIASRVAKRFLDHVAGDSALPEGFEGFPTTPTRAPTPEEMIGKDVRELLGWSDLMLDAGGLIKGSGLRGIMEPGREVLSYFDRKNVWMIRVNTDSKDEASRVGKRAQANLISRRNLRASQPYLHSMDLYVAYRGGYVVIPGIPEHGPRDTSVADLKYEIMRKGKAVFGSTGIHLAGHAGAYTLVLSPGKRELKGKFRESRITAPTLEEINSLLDEAIIKVKALL